MVSKGLSRTGPCGSVRGIVPPIATDIAVKIPTCESDDGLPKEPFGVRSDLIETAEPAELLAADLASALHEGS